MTEARLQPPPDARDCRMQADSPAAWLNQPNSVKINTAAKAANR